MARPVGFLKRDLEHRPKDLQLLAAMEQARGRNAGVMCIRYQVRDVDRRETAEALQTEAITAHMTRLAEARLSGWSPPCLIMTGWSPGRSPIVCINKSDWGLRYRGQSRVLKS